MRDVSRSTPLPNPISLVRWFGAAALAELQSWFSGIPGHRFGLFGRAIGVRAILAGELVQGAALVLTPVNSVRYWEFDFADRHLPAFPRAGAGR